MVVLLKALKQVTDLAMMLPKWLTRIEMMVQRLTVSLGALPGRGRMPILKCISMPRLSARLKLDARWCCGGEMRMQRLLVCMRPGSEEVRC